ncbi:MAG: AEC family transporter [Proteobacteria bacterium]|nr:AEC family transporter [Pseudomonadota bacterium]MBU1581752.1 AEC family transporter [Pseudomonadota bacterium]MBU2454025.1 AEC family transporter [Pseudomonadota bacterium]MBU2628680.1 AEC family transporter [Pseudomonadota bacterium]
MFLQVLKIFIDIVTPVFSLVFLGYFVGPRLKLDARTLSRTAYFLLVPCFVFNMLSKLDIEVAVAGQMILYTTLTHILVAVTAFITARLLKRSREVTAAFVIIATFGNVGNLGLSLIDFRLGPAAQISATIYFITIVLVSFVICVGISSWTRGTGLSAVLSVFKTPALIAMVPAMLFYGTDLEPPLFLSRITELLGRAMIPVMLVTLGVQLSDLHKFKFSVDVVVASFLRLVAAPLIAFGLTAIFSLSGMEIRSGILQAGMPVAVLGSIIAIEYNIIPEFVTTAVLFSTVFSLLTLTFLLYLV